MTRSMEELTAHTAVTSWVPVDSYIDTVIEGAVSYGQLSGVITLADYDMQACDGDIIQVRYVRSRTAQGAMGEGADGDCLSATSQTVGTNSVQIYKYGDYDKIPGFVEFETCGPIRAQILNEMSKGLAKKRDELVYAQVATGEPNTTFTTVGAWQAAPTYTGSCCTFGFNLYNCIVQGINHLAGDSVKATHIIMHPTVSQYLYFREAGSMPDFASSIQYDNANGQIRSILGVTVIESANANTGASGATVAVIVDKSRAVAEAWGKKPTFSSVYEPECDYTKEVLWMYYGTGRMHSTAVANKMEGVIHILSA